MKIDLKDILKGKRDYGFLFEPSWWIREDELDPVMGLKGPLRVGIFIEPAGSRFFLKGTVKGGLVLRCDRCLEEFVTEMEQPFELILTRKKKGLEPEKELTKEELLEEVIEGDELMVEPLVREQIYLFLPMKCLCSEGCKGLCPGCGANLNKERCVCGVQRGHPAFLKLKKLL